MTTQHTRYFAVIGRLYEDDEDSVLCLQAENEQAASDAFVQWRWDQEENVNPDYVAEAEMNDIGVSVSMILESDAPIRTVVYNH